MKEEAKISISHLKKKYEPDSENRILFFSKNINPNAIFSPDEKNQYVLNEINLDIKEHEFHVFLGASGCGKTTLLNIIAGLLPCTEGSVTLDGKEIKNAGPERGVVFQNADAALFPWLTCYKNVEYALKPKKLTKAERKIIVERTLKLVGMEEHRDKYPSELSGGMKQRLQIARSIASNPEILIMDEPFGALDAQTRNTLQEELIRIWKETGKTILFVTHDLNEAALLGEKISILSASPNARILHSVEIPFEYPRDINNSEFSLLITELHKKLNQAVNIHNNKNIDKSA